MKNSKNYLNMKRNKKVKWKLQRHIDKYSGEIFKEHR